MGFRYTLKVTCFAHFVSSGQWSGRYWIGWHDMEEEGVFADANTGELMPKEFYSNFKTGEPNGLEGENCIMAYVFYNNAWNDQDCSREFCSFCELERAPDIQIRGTAVANFLLQ